MENQIDSTNADRYQITELKTAIIKNAKDYLSFNLDEDEILHDTLANSLIALEAIEANRFDFANLTEILTFYLINSKDEEIGKKTRSKSVTQIIDTLQELKENKASLDVLTMALHDTLYKN